MVEIDNKPGTLEQVAATLAKANVNINYIYGAGTQNSPGMLVFNVDDLDRATALLGSTHQAEAATG